MLQTEMSVSANEFDEFSFVENASHEHGDDNEVGGCWGGVGWLTASWSFHKLMFSELLLRPRSFFTGSTLVGGAHHGS